MGSSNQGQAYSGKRSKESLRNFVYIDDAVNAVIKALDRNYGYEVYNVCMWKPQTVEKVIEMIQSNPGCPVTIEYTKGTPKDQFSIYGDDSKIRSQLEWSPKQVFCDGMKKMIDGALEK